MSRADSDAVRAPVSILALRTSPPISGSCDVFVAPVQGRLGGQDRQGNEGKQCKEGFHVGGFLELSRRILDRKQRSVS